MKALTALLAIALGMAPTAAALHFDGPDEVILGESVELEIISDGPFAWFLMFDAGTPVYIDGPGFPDYCIPEPGCPCGCMRFGEYCACMLTVTPGGRWICQLTSTASDLATEYRIDLLDGDLVTVLDTHTITVVPAPPTLEVLAPDGGEELVAGATYKIEWTDSRNEANCPSDYSLELSTDNGQSWAPMDSNSVSETCSYDWLVPAVDSNECLVCITDINEPSIHDTSDAVFSISTPLQQPRIITVDDDAPADFNNIQAAIDDADDGDTILVADGVYRGNGNRDIDFLGKAITVKSENGPGNCIIDCNASEADRHRAFHFRSGENRDSALIGFTITNAYAPAEDCLPRPPFTCSGVGGAVFCEESHPVISHCIIAGNRSEEGAGIYCDGGAPEISHCTITGNYARDRAGGIRMHMSEAVITHCIIRGNTAPTDPEMYFSGYGYWMTITYSNIQSGWPHRGNIYADPWFADPGYWHPNGTPEDVNDDYWLAGDYHLKSQGGRWDVALQEWVFDDVTSPCIDAGDPTRPIGFEPFPNGGTINMGAYGVTHKASKSHFGDPPCEKIVAGDVNGDCIINFEDFRLIGMHWSEDNSLPDGEGPVYVFVPDAHAMRTSGGFDGGGLGSSSIEGWFELNVDSAAGTTEFSRVEATLSGAFAHSEDLDGLLCMTEMVSTDANDTTIDFAWETGSCGSSFFRLTHMNFRATFEGNAVHLVGNFCHPCCDLYCYHLDAVAVRQ
ncbi:MAG: right-handed parallel beta-helix repeat-containing protein [Planctomycetota bacterium]|jgi:hypothetical protein